ncbi:hypothetical protein XENOCAPTIV_028651, partial [Xenoophorus captivus]
GAKSCWFTVLASSHVPVHVTSLDKADSIYKRHAGHALLGVSHMTAVRLGATSVDCCVITLLFLCCVQVPLGGSERMEQFPVLVPQDFSLEGRGYLEAAADITLSSAGRALTCRCKAWPIQLTEPVSPGCFSR